LCKLCFLKRLQVYFLTSVQLSNVPVKPLKTFLQIMLVVEALCTIFVFLAAVFPLRFYTEQMFVSVRMQMRNHADTKLVKRLL